MRIIVVLLLCAPNAVGQDYLPADGDWLEYKHNKLIRTSGGAFPVINRKGYLGNFEPFRSNPYGENPFNTEMFESPGGGLVAFKDRLTVRKWIDLNSLNGTDAVGGKIKRWRRRSEVTVYRNNESQYYYTTHYVYPVGFRVAETIAYDGKVFEVRSLEKSGDKQWDFDLVEVGKAPHGYAPPSDCRSCHALAGAEALRMPVVDGRKWWGYGIAPGDDFVISFDPGQFFERYITTLD